MDKTVKPTETELINPLNESYAPRKKMRDHVVLKVANGIEEWDFPVINDGWSFHIKDKKCAMAGIISS